MATDRQSLQALKDLLEQTDLLLETTTPLPENRTTVCRENLSAAIALTDDLMGQVKKSAAEVLGSKGGKATSQKLGKDHYRKMAAARKTHAGGRPRKNPN